MARTLKIYATPPQAEFHALTTRFNLFVGGFGCGKTETLANQAILDASCGSNALVALYAPTYDLVRLIIAQRMIEKLNHFGIAHNYNKSHNEIYTSASGFGDFILRTLDKPERIVGYESSHAHIDELDTLSMKKADEAWIKILGRTRKKIENMPVINPIRGYTTPEGYRFAYHRWVKKGGKEYSYVQASSLSNPYLDESYIKGLLDTYPPEYIDAYINGEFVPMNGKSVYNSYDRKAHNSNEVIKPGETLYIGCDFNVTKQAATIYVRREGGKQWHAVEELVDMYDTPEMVRIIKERWSDHKIVVYPDGSGNSRKSVDASISDIALLQKAKFEIRAKRAKNGKGYLNPGVKDRVMAMNGALSHGFVYVNHRACPTVANCLEQQPYNKNGEPDKTSGVDHQNDATTYVIAYEMPIRKPVAHIPISFAV